MPSLLFNKGNTMSSELTVDMVSWALSLEKIRAAVAAENIANKNISNTTKVANFEEVLASLENALNAGDTNSAKEILANNISVDEVINKYQGGTNSLDAQVADLSSASGRYKTIADALSRKFSIMSTATRGR